MVMLLLFQGWFQPSQKGYVKTMKAGMGKGRFLLIHKLSFHLSACFLVSFLRLLTSSGSSVSTFLLQPDSDNILQGLPNIVHSQIQSPVFCKSNSQFNYESVECIGMPSFFCCQKPLSISSIVRQVMRGSCLLLCLTPFVYGSQAYGKLPL